jgi:hypothetical protein
LSQDRVNEFLNSAQQSGLLSAEEAATLSREMRDSGAATKQDVAAKLVEKDVLTAYQAEQLLAGHGAECVLVGRYQIQDRLGAGAMGTVYRALDTKLDRAVAIKMLPAQSVTDAGALARFQREAKALAKLSHPNIIQAYDSDQDSGRQFLVMEYAKGTSLNDLIRAKGRIAPSLAADYVYQAALGLHDAHEKGLVHRDLKPGNLLLTPLGQVKILDLGLARFLQDQVGDATLTRDGVGMGTPDYMAPEQFHDARHVDSRSDIYSLGCTLYHLIAGRVPFPGTSMSEKYAAHEQQEPAPLTEFCPDVPAGLATTVSRMMAKRPADRFQSARELAGAIAPYVAGSSHAMPRMMATASWHGSQLGRSVEPIGRRRRQFVVGSAGIFFALVVLVLVFWAVGAFRPTPTDGGVDSNQPTVTDTGKSVALQSGPIALGSEPPKPVEFPKQAVLIELPGWQILADASRDAIQSWLDTRKESNHSVMWLDCIQVGKEPIFTAVAALDDRSKDWLAFLDITAAEMNDVVLMLKRFPVFDYLATSLSGYDQENEVKCAGLFHLGTRSKGAIGVTEMSALDLTLAISDQSGHVTRLLRPFPVDGDQLRCAIYAEAQLQVRSKYGFNLTEAELLERLAADAKDGYLPNVVVAYPARGEAQFATVSRKNTTNAVWEVHRNLTAADLSAKARSLSEKQFTPAALTAYAWDGAVRYCGVWVKEPPRPVAFPRQATLINHPGWEIIVDASKEEIQKWLDDRKSANHSVVWLDSVLVADKPLFSAIAALDDRQAGWIALPDMPASNFARGPIAQSVDFLAHQLLSLSGFSQNGEIRSTTLWASGAPPTPTIFPEMTLAMMDDVDNELRARSSVYRLVRPYPVAGDDIMVAFYAVRFVGGKNAYLRDASASQMMEFVRDHRDAGALIISLAAYPKNGQLLYAVVTGPNPQAIEWHVEHELTVDHFKSKHTELAEQGFRPANVTACPWDGAVRYAVVWVKEPVNQE